MLRHIMCKHAALQIVAACLNYSHASIKQVWGPHTIAVFVRVGGAMILAHVMSYEL